jgi:hypothetical protein
VFSTINKILPSSRDGRVKKRLIVQAELLKLNENGQFPDESAKK